MSVKGEKQQNPILQKLSQWLVDNAVSHDGAENTITRLQEFCSNRIAERLRCPVDLGVTAKKSKLGGVTVWLCVLWPSSLDLNVIENNQLANDLIGTFAHEVEIPLLPNPAVHFEYFLPEDVTPTSFTARLRGLYGEGREYIGVFPA